jgi:NADH:ubiquinone oxidoreductase subunit K
VSAVVAYAGTCRYGLLADARFLISENAWLRRASDLWGNLQHDYFWSSSGQTIPYWRPVTKASWLIEWLVGGGSPVVFHAVQVAWWGIACAGVTALAVQLGAAPRWAVWAGIAAALHPAATEPVSLVMARSDVVATAAALWSLVAFGHWLHRPTPWRMAAVCGTLVLALGSKEASVGLVVVMAAWRWRSLTPAAPPWRSTLLPAALTTLAYLILRAWVLRGHASTRLDVQPLRWLGALGGYAQGLLPGRMQTGLGNLPVAWATSTAFVVSAGVAVTLWILWLVWAWRRARLDLVALLWLAVSLAPVVLVGQLHVPNTVGKIALADRWLLPAAVAMQVLLALALSRLVAPRLAHAAMLVAAAWLAVRAADVPRAHASYADEVALMALEEANLQRLPAHLRTDSDACRAATRAMVRAGQQGRPAEVLALATQLPPACRGEPEVQFNRVAALVGMGRFAEAVDSGLQLLGSARLEPRFATAAQALVGRAEAALGRCAQAGPRLRAALRGGSEDCQVPVELGRCVAQTGQIGEAAEYWEQAAGCLEPHHPQGAVAVWLMAAQARRQQADPLAVERALQRVRGRIHLLPAELHGLARAFGLIAAPPSP